MTQATGVPLSEVLSSTKFLLGFTSNDSDAYLMTLISDGAQRCEASANYTYFEVTLQVVNNVAVLPNGVLWLESVRFTNTNGAYIYPYYLRPSFVSISPSSPNIVQCTNTFYSEGDSLIFSPLNNMPQMTSVDVAYNGLAIDGNGIPIMSAGMAFAVKFYAAWQYVATRPDKYTPNQAALLVNNFEKQWAKNVMRVRRDLPKFINVEDLGRVYNSIYFRQPYYALPTL